MLGGGLPKHGTYLLQGNPGVGKTTFALQFLLESAAHQETGMYVSFSESRDEIRAVGRSHGWALDRGFELQGLTVTRRSLEDVYLELVGHRSDS